MFDQGDRLAMAQLQARVEELEKIEDANRATIRNLSSDKVRFEEEGEVLRDTSRVDEDVAARAVEALQILAGVGRSIRGRRKRDVLHGGTSLLDCPNLWDALDDALSRAHAVEDSVSSWGE